ncbi:MAG TPA: PIG-L deacetylase family protein [Candidatus Binatia bacterium]|nr:PIG-L deacetylase family protein [Candidatus Binatia bacterium]
MNVLVVTAHHDDLELGCGGTVARLVDGGHHVTSLVMTHSGYRGPDGLEVRSAETAIREARRAAEILGYDLVTLNADTLDIAENDANVCEIVSLIKRLSIDTVMIHWHADTHPPHQRVHRMAIHAARHVPRILGFAVNWYLGDATFAPRLFVGITESQWQRKIQALRCYEGELRRTGERWIAHVEHVAAIYGTTIGVARAEGFVPYKFVWDIAKGESNAAFA